MVPDPQHPNAQLVTALGALHKLHVPLNVREAQPEQATKLDRLGLLSLGQQASASQLLRQLDALQSSFALCRDLGDSDPQHMAPGPAAALVQQHFQGSAVKVSVEEDVEVLKKQYPLFAAVSRGCNHIPEHKVSGWSGVQVEEVLKLIAECVVYT